MSRKISDIQTDLDTAYAARRKALEALSYSQNSGQGSISVTRASLDSITSLIKDLESELADASTSSRAAGVFCPVFDRGNL
jgi:hypothetical protein